MVFFLHFDLFGQKHGGKSGTMRKSASLSVLLVKEIQNGKCSFPFFFLKMEMCVRACIPVCAEPEDIYLLVAVVCFKIQLFCLSGQRGVYGHMRLWELWLYLANNVWLASSVAFLIGLFSSFHSERLQSVVQWRFFFEGKRTFSEKMS